MGGGVAACGEVGAEEVGFDVAIVRAFAPVAEVAVAEGFGPDFVGGRLFARGWVRWRWRGFDCRGLCALAGAEKADDAVLGGAFGAGGVHKRAR